jgi:hypothetical protein
MNLIMRIKFKNTNFYYRVVLNKDSIKFKVGLKSH